MIPALPTVEEKLITGEELLEMSDIGRAELIDGRIVYMPPAGGEHGYLEIELGAILRDFVRVRKLGWVLSGEVGVYIRRNPDRVRAPDVMFYSRARMPKRPRRQFLEVAPELAVEIVSPTDRWEDIRQKLRDYFSIGIERVWLVEPEEQDVIIYRAPHDSVTVGAKEILKGEGVLSGFELRVADLFEEE